MIIVNNPVTVADASVTAPKLSGAQTGSAPIFGVRAWVNFNGTGTVAIRGSGNVSSVTDRGAGLYTVNFTTALPNALYAVAGSVESAGGTSSVCQQSTGGGNPPSGAEKSTTACQIVVTGGGLAFDGASISVFFVG
jgi:hypothetical protein